MTPESRAQAVVNQFDGCAGCAHPEISVGAIAAAIREATAPLEARTQELEAGFDLRWEADQRAVKMWHDAGGDKLEWPDHADLVVWLLGRIDELEATLEDEEASHQETLELWKTARSRADALEARVRELEAEVARLKRGVPLHDFEQGCREYQAKLFGKETP